MRIFFFSLLSLFVSQEALAQSAFESALEKGLQAKPLLKKEAFRDEVKEKSDSESRIMFMQSGKTRDLLFNAESSRNFTYDLESEASSLLESRRREFLSEEAQFYVNRTVHLSDVISVVLFDIYLSDMRIPEAFIEVSFRKTSDGFAVRGIKNRSFTELAHLDVSRDVNMEEVADATGWTHIENLESENVWRVVEMQQAAVLEPMTAFRFDYEGQEYRLSISRVDGRIFEAAKKEYSTRPQRLKAEFSVWGRSYLDGSTVESSLPFTTIFTDDGEVQTQGDGSLESEASLTGEVRLANGRISLHDQSFARQPYSITTTVGAGPVALSTADRRAVNAYVAINDINNFVRNHVDPSETRFLDRLTPVRINLDDSCNAYYDGRISLFSAGDGCANMAEVNDVIYHEWGHGLDDFTGRTMGIQDGAFSEGIGDIVASYFVGSPNMGSGFFQGNVLGIRRLDNSFRYPEDRGSVHDEGRIIGGVFWDLREALIERYGETKGKYTAEKYFFRHLLVADSYTESYEIVLTLDDQDGDAMTRSPNFCLITKAFSDHGLAEEDLLEGCVDEGFVLEKVIDPELHIALIPEGDQVQLAVSHAEELDLKLCFAETVQCNDEVSLELEGQKDGKFFYTLADSIELQNQQFITVFYRTDNQDFAGRSFKIVGR